MLIPTAVFLDTSIFDSQQYNFQSTALATFVPACAKRQLALLLPDPTEREIKRHLRNRVAEVLTAVEGARRKAPFLARLKGFAREFSSPEIEAYRGREARESGMDGIPEAVHGGPAWVQRPRRRESDALVRQGGGALQ